jgi:N6-adenosine-specific RNA methylase IME4
MIPLPDKKYSIIYADPPWSYQNRGTRAAASKHYDTMTIEDIKRMGVGASGGGIANEDCVLFMWATFPMLREALDVIEAWGFSYKTVAFNWVKQNRNGTGIFMGLGNWTRSNSEICLLATKGKPKRISGSVRSIVLSPLQQHSRKPAEIRDRIVELMGDLPRIELFAREAAPGWDVWGNEAPTPEIKDAPADSVEERRKHMNQTTKETRRRSYDAVLPKRAARCRLILETLGNRELTASEITEELVAAGRIPYFNRNYVAPRLTELKEIGILTTVGRRKATRSDATEAVWARAEPSGPTGQTAAAYADNPTEAEQMTLGSAT